MLGREPANLPAMRRHLERAIELDPSFAEALAVLGAIVDGVLEWKWQVAESRCRQAIAMDPRSAHLHNVYGTMLSVLGRDEEAVTTLRRAVELDPLGPLWNACLIQVLMGPRDWDAVFRQTRATLDVAPDYWFALFLAGQAHAACGQFDEAVATSERAVRASGAVPYTVGLLGNVLARAGRRDEALQQLATLQTLAATDYVPAIAVASVYAGLGDRDEAFARLERGLGTPDAMLTYSLTTYPVLDDLRPDPRFKALRRRIGLDAA